MTPDEVIKALEEGLKNGDEIRIGEQKLHVFEAAILLEDLKKRQWEILKKSTD